MGYWTKCKICGAGIYMAKVMPPNGYEQRWLPFEDEELDECHIDKCDGWSSLGRSEQTLIEKKQLRKKKEKFCKVVISCLSCDRRFRSQVGLAMHISAKHPELWMSHVEALGVSPYRFLRTTRGLKRCEHCGALVKNLEVHNKKYLE